MRHNTKIWARLSRARLMATTATIAGLVAGQALGQTVTPTGGPVGGHVASGVASISTSGATTTIAQSSAKGIIDWTGFSIGQGQTVQFNNGTGATLNRVTGGNLSSIDGLLSATGSVYLINPNGVVIGKAGVVRTGGTFVASTLDVADADFLKGGDLTLDGLSGAAIVNLGQVGALGGNVALMAAKVENDGTITAANGTVGLLAGHSILMRDTAVDDGLFTILTGGADTSITATGAISAAAVELRANGGNIYALAGNTNDFINATGVGSVDGKVWLTAGGSGSVTASGKISATLASGDGGTVETSGGTVDFTGLQVDTTGTTGKTGTWLVDPYDLTIDSSAATTISNNLATTNVTLQTTNTGTSGPGTANSAGVGDIDINSTIGWSSANTLTLDAYHGININAGITVSGAGAVVLKTNDGGTGGDYGFGLGPTGFAGSLDYTGTGGALTINGSSYTLVNSMTGLAGLNGQSGHYALATSLSASGTSYVSALVASFGGIFTGLGHTVSGLTIISSTNYVGLFGQTTGTLRDVGLVGGQMTGTGASTDDGSLTGYLSGAVLNAYSSAAVGGVTYVGGLIGATDSRSTVDNVYATGTVTGADTGTGGLIGIQDGTLSNAYATGAVTGAEVYVGGLIGLQWGTASTSYATGAVTGANGVGGLVGEQQGGIVSTSYATGTVEGVTGGVGGLIGYSFGSFITRRGSTVSTSYSTGAVICRSDTGGAVGDESGSTITDVYYDSLTTGQSDTGKGLGETTSQLQAGTLPSGFSASDWGVGAGLYPYLKAFNASTPQAVTGYARNSGGTAVAGAQVALYGSGQSLTVGTVSTGANGYFYALLPLGTVTSSTHLGETLTANGATALGGMAYTDTPLASANIVLGSITIATGDTTYSHLVSDLYGAFGSSNYALSSYALRDSPLQITASGSFSVNGELGQVGTITVDAAGGNLTLQAGSSITSYGSGNAIVLAANGSFVNNAGSNALSASAGRWLIYSQATGDASTLPAGNDAGGLSGTSYYNDAFDFSTASFASKPGSGNRFVYGYAPTLTIAPTTTSVTYNGSAQTDSYNVAGYVSTADQSADRLSGSVGGLTTSSGNAATYTLTAAGSIASSENYGVSYASGDFTINPAALTLAAVTDSKTYDATTSSTGRVGVSGLQGTDTVTGDTQSFTSKNALGAGGSTLAVNSGYTINDGNGGGNYTVTTQTASGTINPAALTLAAATDTKTYDATTTSTGVVGVSGLKGSDTVTGDTQSFGSKNVLGAGGSTLAIDSGYTINDGNGGGNYTVTTQTASGTINPAALTLAAATDTKTYDATTSSTSVVSVLGLRGKDTVTGDTQAFTSKNVLGAGSSTLAVNSGYTVNDGNGGSNYIVTTQTASGTINPAALTLAAVSDSKTYDATTTSTGTVSVLGLKGSDTVSGDTQSFTSKNVLGANGSTLAVNSGYTVNDGNGGNNYTISKTTAAGTINPAALILAATTDSKTYDATTSSTGTVGVSGLQGTDTVTGDTQSFTSKNALGAGGSTLAVNSGYTINDGNGGGNYTVTTQTASGTINPAALTLAAVSDSKTYDAMTTSTGTVSVLGLKGSDTVTGDTQSFGSKNVLGAGGSTLAVDSGYTVNDGNSGSNYTVTTRTASGTINPAALTLAAVSDSKTYDATTDSTGTVKVTGLKGSDTVNGALQSFDSKNAGARTLVVSGYTVNDGNSGGNYTIATRTAEGVINQAALTLAAVTDTKTYDATTTSTGVISVIGLKGSDTVSGDTQAFTSKNVLGAGGSTLAVNGGYTVNDGNGGGNYTVNARTASGTITAAPLLLAAASDTKTYDGTTTSNAAVSVEDLQGSDTVGNATQSFGSKNAVGTGGSILVVNGGYVINDGNGGNNYAVGFKEASGTIDPAALTLAAVTGTKVYDATTTSSGTVGVSGLVGGDSISGLSQSYDSANAGARTLSVNGGYAINDGNGGGNYTVSTVTAAGTITQRPITTTGLTWTVADASSTYGVTAVLGTATLNGLVSSDSGAVSGVVNAFSGSTQITLTNRTSVGTYLEEVTGLSGTAAGNYYLLGTGNTNGILTINPATLTASLIGATSKTYDGSTSAALTASNYNLSGVISGDTVALDDPASGAYADKNAGSGKTVSVTGLALSGSDASNYALGSTTASAAIGTINPAALTLAATTDTKTYDASTSSSGTVAVSGLQGSDTVSGDTQSFTSKNVLGTNASTLAVNSGYTVNDGNGGGNYTVGMTTASGTITPAALTLAAASDAKTYDASTSSSGTVSVSGLKGSDTVTGDTQAFTSKNVLGTNASTLAVNSGYAVNDGNGGNNYTVGTTTASGTITPAALTLAAASDAKTYDATTVSSGTVSVSGLRGSDTITGDTQAFTSKNVLGTGGSTLAVNSGYTVNDGNGGNNYIVRTITASGTIDPAALIAALTGADTKIYDATTTASLTAANYSLSGVKGNDSVALDDPAAGAYADVNAGTGKKVSVTGLALTGADAGNYTVNATASANVGTITPAALTVAADDLSKLAGQPDPALTFEITAGKLFGSDALSGGLARASGTDAGTYAITQGTLSSSSNYSLAFVPGQLTIAAATAANPGLQNAATPLGQSTGAPQPPTPADGADRSAGAAQPGSISPYCATLEDKCFASPYPDNTHVSSQINYEGQ